LGGDGAEGNVAVGRLRSDEGRVSKQELSWREGSTILHEAHKRVKLEVIKRIALRRIKKRLQTNTEWIEFAVLRSQANDLIRAQEELVT